MDINYLNELHREKQDDIKFKKLYSDIIDLLKFKQETLESSNKDLYKKQTIENYK